jgi:hypothetical protein
MNKSSQPSNNIKNYTHHKTITIIPINQQTNIKNHYKTNNKK